MMPPPLAETLLDLLAQCRREQLALGWPEVPEWVFCSRAGKERALGRDQLGHASPMLTLKTYEHAMREEEVDLSFASFGSGS